MLGEASDGHEAVEAAAALRPQVIVMDFALPSMNGAVATRRIREAQPQIAILILSMHAEAELCTDLPGSRSARLSAEERDGPGAGFGGTQSGGGRTGAGQPFGRYRGRYEPFARRSARGNWRFCS